MPTRSATSKEKWAFPCPVSFHASPTDKPLPCTGKTWSSCDKLNEHIKRSHSRRPYCPKCKVSFRKDASEKELQEQKQRHEEQKQRDEATCVETNWPDDNRILSESQDEGFRGFKKTKAKIYRGCIRSDILLQNWRNMNLSLGFPEVDASIMEGWRVGPGSGSVATVPHHALRPTRNTPKPAHDTSELEAVQLGQSGGYPQTIGPPGDIAMDIGSNTVMLDIFTDTLDPALTSGYSGDISPEQRRQDALTCTPLAPRGPIVPTSDASTLVAETESSDTTLHDEELGQPLQDYESGKKWVMEASEGAERIQRAFVMFDKHSELSGKHSGLSDSFFTLAGNLTAAHDGAKSQHSQDGSWGSAPEGNRTPPPTLEGLSPNH
ncbi:hypothetical protein B0T18DRAFT_34451 [Schizothecium vesticola]|uniref:Uncharacterized protein n=1 Tax=Schizothecium vesticola TaxID=314040 RepID=A0AA40FBJ6_9PEZI|nr:hypothetical protein B0T18DRAFT_34451 [Schizothecium vesticola]